MHLRESVVSQSSVVIFVIGYDDVALSAKCVAAALRLSVNCDFRLGLESLVVDRLTVRPVEQVDAAVGKFHIRPRRAGMSMGVTGNRKGFQSAFINESQVL